MLSYVGRDQRLHFLISTLTNIIFDLRKSWRDRPQRFYFRMRRRPGPSKPMIDPALQMASVCSRSAWRSGRPDSIPTLSDRR